MRTFAWPCILTLALLPIRTGMAQTGATVAEVENLMRRLTDAVNRQDGMLMTSVYVLEDPLVFSSHAVYMTRRDSLHAIYLAWDPAKTKGTFLAFEGLSYRPLGPDAMLVTGRLRLAPGTPTGTAADTLRGSWTGVFERRKGRWGLAHEHESFQR
jgi:ketosteroid isomerase-like protein